LFSDWSLVLYDTIPPVDSVSQVVDVISQLNSIVDQVFGRIRTRLENEKSRLDSITTRIDVANAKTESLTKRNLTSTVVTSPFFFPVENITPYQPIHLPNKESFPKPRGKTSKVGRSSAPVLPLGSFLEEPYFFLDDHRSSKTNPKSIEKAREISSVDDCVVFLEKEIKKEKRSNPSRKEKETQKRKKLEPFMWENISSSVLRSGLRYCPTFNENFPKPTLPSHLSVPNVAEDVNILKDSNFDSIAPTLTLLDLPEPLSPSPSSTLSTDRPQEQTKISVAPPPPPPEEQTKISVAPPLQPSPLVTRIPPPPPPPEEQTKISVAPPPPPPPEEQNKISVAPPPPPPQPSPLVTRIPPPPPPPPVQQPRIGGLQRPPRIPHPRAPERTRPPEQESLLETLIKKMGGIRPAIEGRPEEDDKEWES